MKYFLSFFVAAFFLATAAPVLATQTDPDLDAVFSRLQETHDPVEAENLQKYIWRLWVKTDNRAVRELFEESREMLLRNDYLTALGLASQIVQLAPDHAEGWNLRATIFYALGDYDSSIADVEKTLMLEPRHFGALVGLGMMYVDMGRDKEALSAFRRALAVNPHLDQARQRIKSMTRELKDGGI
jgi:tetratricopeptide (TPR) repeat protein